LGPHDPNGTKPTDPLLSLENLSTGYGKIRVVFDVSMHVGTGEIVGVLGHNGSGKSTTIKTVLGVLPAQGGKVIYEGVDVTKRGSCL
jgi:ABC-type branched-subunit amino acid transport system ATPase component